MNDDATPQPSARAAERLGAAVAGELTDLRSSLAAALEDADRFEADGREDLAVAVLEEQRALLSLVHARLEQSVAGAVVEREAEHVVGAAMSGLDATGLVDEAAGAPAADRDRPVAPEPTVPVRELPSVPSFTGRLLASAAAAVLGIALLVTPDVQPGGLAIAGSPGTDRPSGQADAATDRDESSEVPDHDPAAAADRVPDEVLGTSIAPHGDRQRSPEPSGALVRPRLDDDTDGDGPVADTPIDRLPVEQPPVDALASDLPVATAPTGPGIEDDEEGADSTTVRSDSGESGDGDDEPDGRDAGAGDQIDETGETDSSDSSDETDESDSEPGSSHEPNASAEDEPGDGEPVGGPTTTSSDPGLPGDGGGVDMDTGHGIG